jgi:GABA(A) receptor-associated protein
MFATSTSFKREFSYSKRILEAKRIMSKYEDRIPIICERATNAGPDCPLIDKKKYLVPIDLTVAQFIYVVRKRLKLGPEKAMFIFINGQVPTNSHILSDLYHKNKDKDEFLYVTYALENTFGEGVN